jgi:hypothetical protein
VGTFQIWVNFSDSGLYNQGIFSTVVTVLATRPPVVEQPPAVVVPPAAVDPSPPPSSVVPAGSVASTSGAELAATGLASGSLPTRMWAVAGLLILGAALSAAGRLRFRGRQSGA